MKTTAYRNILMSSVLACSMLLGGCSGQKADTAKAADLFFASFNHLCEADTLKGHGTLTAMSSTLPLEFALISSPAQAELLWGESGNPAAAFYLRDGSTYLNYMGTKSSSKAVNLGINPDEPLHLPNPFLEIPREDREKLFDSVKVDGNAYSFVINPSEMAKFLDSYGAVKVQNASLDTVIENEMISSLSLKIEGTYSVDTASTPLNLAADLTIDEAGDPIEIVWPDDLSSWPQQ